MIGDLLWFLGTKLIYLGLMVYGVILVIRWAFVPAAVASVVIAGLGLLVRWIFTWRTFDKRRACWTISVVAWAIRSLCPLREQLDLVQWMREFAIAEEKQIRERQGPPPHPMCRCETVFVEHHCIGPFCKACDERVAASMMRALSKHRHTFKA